MYVRGNGANQGLTRRASNPSVLGPLAVISYEVDGLVSGTGKLFLSSRVCQYIENDGCLSVVHYYPQSLARQTFSLSYRGMPVVVVVGTLKTCGTLGLVEGHLRVLDTYLLSRYLGT